MNNPALASKTTILVVDDTPANLTLLNELLKDEYLVKVATGGARALEIARAQTPPDLILLDVLMPGIDGYAVCRELKQDHRTRHIPVIFLTTRADPADEERGLQLGAADYIAKPISPPVVLARIRTQLQLQRYASQLELLILQHTAELANTRSQYQKLLERGAELTYESDPGDLLRRALQTGMDILGCDAAAYLARSDKDQLQLAQHTRTPATGGADIALTDPHTRQPNHQDIFAACVHSGNTVLVDDLAQETQHDVSALRRLDKITNYQTISLLALPVQPRNGAALGVMCFFNALATPRGPVTGFAAANQVYVEALVALTAGLLARPH